MGARIVVVGSCNLDEVILGPRFPGPGETVSADSLTEEPGGKGLNQALAAARMGADVTFVGAVGEDRAGAAVRDVLTAAGIDVRLLREVPGPTGRAFVVVERGHDHENRIIIVPGANGAVLELDPEAREAVVGADALLVQLEVPMSLVVDAAVTAATAGVVVGLTPAPVRELPDELLAATSILFANESEASLLDGRLSLVPEVVLTRGSRGSDYAHRDGTRLHCPAHEVPVVDTTAAGDVYAGVFTAVRCRGEDVATAMRLATAAASLAVQRPGTSGSIPTAAEVEALIRD
ncbi:MAG: ribokinase [Nocardioides sp.]